MLDALQMAFFLAHVQMIRLEKAKLSPSSPKPSHDLGRSKTTVAFDYRDKKMGWRIKQWWDQQTGILKLIMKTDVSSFGVMQTTKISTSSREISCFHSKTQRIKQTTRSFVLSLHKMAIFEICICLFLICRCWGLVTPFSVQRLYRWSCRTEKYNQWIGLSHRQHRVKDNTVWIWI